ncbi:hypothetical protein HPB51_022949 [Rhipicephalus microplus]|uniref:Peptidase M13 N-terminal domain-containing protein n=1 Tax=Rhipicephalus microplus TaxID=6941 RepID=A0A9J6DRF7_RHIMP|nr:hypothetical protein HPB51_022949 [Rhipicephalus microplus]
MEEQGTGKSARSRSRRRKSHQGSRRSSSKRLKSPDLPAEKPNPEAAKSTESKRALRAGGAAASKSKRHKAEQPEEAPPRREVLSWNPTPVTVDITPVWQPELQLAGAREAARGSVTCLQKTLLVTVAVLMLTLIVVAYYVRTVTTAPCSLPSCRRVQALLDANLNAVGAALRGLLRTRLQSLGSRALPVCQRHYLRRTAMQKAAMLYQSCAHVYTLDRNHMGETRSLLAGFGVHWPKLSNTSSLLRIFFSMATTWSWACVLQFILQSSGHVTVRPSPFYLSMLSGRQRLLEKGADEDHYQVYYDSMVAAFGGAGARAYSYEELRVLENKVVPVLSAALATPNSTTLKNSTINVMVNKTANPIPSSVWESSIRSSLNLSEGLVLLVSIESVDFFKQFFALVVNETEAVMAYYVGWVVAQALSLMSSSEAIKKYFMSNKTLASKEHALFCAGIAHVYMGIAFYANYMTRQVTRRMLADVLTIEKTVQKALRGHLGASPWFATIPEPMLTDAALVNSLRLLEAPNATVLDDMYGAFPDMSENVFDNVRHAAEARAKTAADISMAEFVTSGTARLFFHSTHEQFQLLPEILEEPFYELEYPEAVKYATLGGEIAQAYSSAAFAESTDSKLQLAFSLKSACFFERQVLLRHLGQEQVELVRRVTSLHVILSALAEATNGHVQTARLVGYEDWTDVELLLVFWCFVQCGGRNGRRKCNGPLTLVEDFARAFGCKQGDPMYSGHNCAIAR